MKRATLFRLVRLLSSFMALAVGCVPSGTAVETEADFVGEITEIQGVDRGDVRGQVLVEARVTRGDTENPYKYIVTAKDETLIFEEDGGERRPGNFEALAVAQQVQVWFSGPVRESYPAQVDAGQIVIVK